MFFIYFNSRLKALSQHQSHYRKCLSHYHIITGNHPKLCWPSVHNDFRTPFCFAGQGYSIQRLQWRGHRGCAAQEGGLWTLLTTYYCRDSPNNNESFISPQSERSELGAFLFLSRGSKWLLLCVWERGYCNWVCYMGSSEMSQIWVQWSHFLTAIGYCWFWWYFITKVWSLHHIIIAMFINGVCYRGSSNMSQI